MPQEDHRACELNHPEEILWVVFPAKTIASQRAAVLCDWFAPVPAVRRDQFHTEMLAYPLIQWIAVVRFVADQALRCFTEEPPLERGFDEGGFIRRSADHV